MERSLVWSALAIGFVCWLAAYAFTRTKRFALAGINSALPPAFLTIAAGLPALVFMITLPSHGRFFAPGHDLGNGFLLGAAGALLSAVLLIQNLLADAGERSHLRSAAVSACPFGLAVSCTAAPLLFRCDTLYIALLGVAIGWLATTGILLLGLMYGGRGKDAVRPEPVTMLAGATFAALLCATVALGDFHGEVTFIKSSTSISWGVLALASAAAIPLFLLLSAAADMILNPDPDLRAKAKPNATPARSARAALRAQIGRGVIAIAGVAVLDRMLSNHVIDFTPDDVPASPGELAKLFDAVIGPSRLFHVLGLGLLVGLLIWWISVSVQNRDNQDDGSAQDSLPTYAWQNSALRLLVLLTGAMAAYQMLYGFGVGLMLLGMFPAVGLVLLAVNEATEKASDSGAAHPTELAIRVVQLSAMAAILGLFRVYTTINEGLFPHSPYTDQYAAFGFVVGAVLPLFLAGYLIPKQIKQGADPASTLGRLLVSGVLILAIPCVILVLWGQKCTMAFLIVLAITAAGIEPTSVADSLANGIRKLFPAIYALGLALALSEWSHYILDMEDWTRIQKERVVVQIAVAAILLVLGADYGPRIAVWMKRNRSSALKPNTGGKGAAR
jgi:hypothetical protein